MAKEKKKLIDCEECDGSGECLNCGGEGSFPCSLCEGKGCEQCKDDDCMEECSECSGGGECEHCNGEGKVDDS